ISELSHHGPEDLFISIVTLLGSFIIMCTIEWRLACISFALVPIFIAYTMLQRRNLNKVNKRVKEELAGVNAAVESAISGMRTSKAFNNEEKENEKFSKANGKYVVTKEKYYRAMAVFSGGMEIAMSLMSVAVIAAGGYFIMKNRISYADLIAFTLYVTTFITPIRKLSNFVELFMQGFAGFNRFLQVMRMEPEINDRPGAIDIGTVKGEIEFRDVSFKYNRGDYVLKNVNLKIKPGMNLAVVGPSGGGKTTLCQLIPRFYDVTSGAIYIDGTDIRDVTQQSLRENISTVQQDVFLFADTIMENIRYGKPDASDKEVINAAKRAEIHEDIMQMPDGYQSYVGERGVMLSGGQKQRISIARVFLKNPPIVILDEATSALDSITEARIQSSFDELCAGRTSIIIAHRLSTVRNADLIVVVSDSRIIEQGSPAELLAKNGAYAKLAAYQSASLA
ncbi:MAG: ABC transporter ATP-binding protein, partial [Oscillospiraceae bacterium]|nr:ABC transporter ATP-binding protein [Oscillospiraceae bacterium]